jgi:hypothetical protein
MIGMDLQITMMDDAEHVVPITYGVACRWEDANPGLSPKAFLEDVKFKPFCRLAYEALKSSNITVKAWPQFIDTVKEINWVPKEQKEQRTTTST